jgi:hypothetical protein
MDSADVPLPLRPPPPLLTGPFTRPAAAAVGLDGPTLDRMLRAGVVRRLLRGVYVGSTAAETPALRAEALGLLVRPGAVVVDRTAGWLHGLTAGVGLPGPVTTGLDVLGRRRAGRPRHFGSARRLGAAEVVAVGPVRVTTPVRTALDLARLLGRDRGLAVLDATLRAGHDRTALVAGLAGLGRLPGCARARALVDLADGRAAAPAHSVLRLRWLDAGLPPPVLRLPVTAADGRPRLLALALPAERFGAVVGPRLDVPGWAVVALTAERLLDSDAGLVEAHLRREYLRVLLRRAG